MSTDKPISYYLQQLVNYALATGLIDSEDEIWARNTLLAVLQLDGFEHPGDVESVELIDILNPLLDYAAQEKLLENDSIVFRDLFDTKLMGCLTPPPREVRAQFHQLYQQSPRQATEWFYDFSQNTNYIRRDRSKKNQRWLSETEYGDLEITINLAKPEKDPDAIVAAKNLPAQTYPTCLLCKENEGYAGRIDSPARQNHRIVPLKVNEKPLFLQYSPYVYYPEHCIVFNEQHTPMRISRDTFAKLLDFVGQFPHYFVGSNADLPIVGGSILAHDHFQGGHHDFAMAKAPIETPVSFPGISDVAAGIVRWPMSVLRLSSAHPENLIALADHILAQWRNYTDEQSFIFAQTNGEPHNTITPIARKNGHNFELDLVLRNNIRTAEHPLGVYHPHAELHHIKKENIGLIEVMGLAVLPARLRQELTALGEKLIAGDNPADDPLTASHAHWAAGFAAEITKDSVQAVLKREVAQVFAQVLAHAGVFSRTAEGQRSFLKFVESCT